MKAPRILSIFSFMVGVVVASTLILYFEVRTERPVPVEHSVSNPSTRSDEESQIISVYKTVSPAVVYISTVTQSFDPFDLFPRERVREGSGSGTIIDSKQGIVLTNLHVIQDASSISIFLADGSRTKARLIGTDKVYDIAVLQLADPPPHLTGVEFGDSSQLEIGQRVLAIGNPFGLDRTLTTGIVSSLERTVRSGDGSLMRGLIQTDAAINPGNSGGPLLDINGQLVGINTAILSASGDSAGIGFAAPINQLKRVLPELIRTGKVSRADLGWLLVNTRYGPMVRAYLPGSAAEGAGINPIQKFHTSPTGKIVSSTSDPEDVDVVVSVNGQTVTRKDEVDELISQLTREDEVEFVFQRGIPKGNTWKVKVKPRFR